MKYSTDGIHPRERLSYWVEVATRGYVEHDFIPHDGSTFKGSIQTATLPGLGLARFDAAPAQVTRSDRNAARGDPSDVLVTLLLDGEMAVAQDGRDTVVSGRSLYLLDPMRPFELVLRTHCSSITFKFPRTLLEARVGNTAGLTARPVLPSSGIGALTMGFLELLPEQAESLDDVAGLKVANQLLDLTALALTAGHERATSLSSPRAAALMRLKSTVERLMVEPGVKPERVAAEAGISVRYANALLAEEDTSIERYLNDRRLERCRAALDNPTQAHRSIGEIVYKWGFSDLSHFGRRFKSRYGLTPTDYRRRAQSRDIERMVAKTPGMMGADGSLPPPVPEMA